MKEQLSTVLQKHFQPQKKSVQIGAWLGDINCTEYNCIRIKYKTNDYGFIFGFIYKTETEGDKHADYYCPSNFTEFKIPIEPSLADRLENIYIQNIWNHEKTKIEIKSITFLNSSNSELTKPYPVSNITKVTDNETPNPIAEEKLKDAWDFLPDMGVGFQYTICGGYTYGMDFGYDTSYAWGYPIETKETIQKIKEKGFKTLRLQVTGGFHTIDENYTMDPAFIKQLKKVVDWAIEEGMYVIICEGMSYYYDADSNAFYNKWIEDHVDCTGYCINRKYKSISRNYLQAFWKQITQAFNNHYDEHLVFEFLNEPIDTTHETPFHPNPDCPTCQEDTKLLNEINQIILGIIRNSGGNNAKRYLMVPNLAQDAWNAADDTFEMPEDTEENKGKNKLILAVHNYPMGNAPGLQGDIKETYTVPIRNQRIIEPFKQLDEKFFKNRIPVAVTETGCSRHTNILEELNV